MSSNENDTEVNNAIMALLRRPPVGRKMKTLPLRLHKDEQPPGYGKADEAGAPPSYDTKGEAPDTKEKPSISEKRSVDEEPSVAEKASMATEEAPVADDRFKKPAGFVLDPLYFSRKRAAAAAKKTGPTEVCTQKPNLPFRTIAKMLSKVQVMEAKYQKMMGSLGDMVKTEKEVEQGTKLTDVRIPYTLFHLFENEQLTSLSSTTSPSARKRISSKRTSS